MGAKSGTAEYLSVMERPLQSSLSNFDWIANNVDVTITPRLYAEAIEAYCQKVKRRAVAVYQVGNVSFPGLSDVDLLVIEDRPRLDNCQFYSVSKRLPTYYRKIFLHEPFILPGRMLSVIEHTSHRRRNLVAGTDVLGASRLTVSVDEHWCRLLEGYCNYVAFTQGLKTRAIRSARLIVAVMSALRYMLADLDEIDRTCTSEKYALAIDALRAAMYEPSASITSILTTMWGLFESNAGRLEERIRQTLPLDVDGGESALTYARDFLAGHRAPPGVDVAYVRERAAAIDGYYYELQRLKFNFGFLFFNAAYSQAQNRYCQPGLFRRWLDVSYRMRDSLALPNSWRALPQSGLVASPGGRR